MSSIEVRKLAEEIVDVLKGGQVPEARKSYANWVAKRLRKLIRTSTRPSVKAIQKWMLELCEDPKSCGHGSIHGTKDGLGVCEECGDRGVFTLSAREIADYIARAQGAKG